MRYLAPLLLVILAAAGLSACGAPAVIYHAETVITLDADHERANAVLVERGKIIAVGNVDELRDEHPRARYDDTFLAHTITPGFIDPHIHMLLAAIQYSLPATPPWAMARGEAWLRGEPTRAGFLDRLHSINAQQGGRKPLIVYGYHDLVHGPLDRHDLDAITTDRPLMIWHYSSHDFYLNTKALEWAKIDASLHDQFEGVPLGEDGLPSGRVYEDALPYLYEAISKTLMNPFAIGRGQEEFTALLRRGGVTAVADMGYGIFGLPIENAHIFLNWGNQQRAGYRLYLIPEHRGFQKRFGDERIQKIQDLAYDNAWAPATVLPRVKLFADAAFYSQTMKLDPPGYLTGQSAGEDGLWVTGPDELIETMSPYWRAGLSLNVHSNGDAAQRATLDAFQSLHGHGRKQNFVIEHGGMFSPADRVRAGRLQASVSAASHYVFYLGERYQAPLGARRGDWISPLASLAKNGANVTLHSDAPLAPPLPLRAAAVHLTRATREGGVLTPEERLSRHQALAAITINAAQALGVHDEIGSIAPGKRADFTILDANPLETPGDQWADIGVWGVVLDGKKKPLK